MAFQPTAQPGHPTTQQPAEFDVWRLLQPELGRHPITQQPAEFGVWLTLQPAAGWHPTTQQPAEFDVWPLLQPELGRHPITQQSEEFEVRLPFQPELGGHPTTQQSAKFQLTSLSCRHVVSTDVLVWLLLLQGQDDKQNTHFLQYTYTTTAGKLVPLRAS